MGLLAGILERQRGRRASEYRPRQWLFENSAGIGVDTVNYHTYEIISPWQARRDDYISLEYGCSPRYLRLPRVKDVVQLQPADVHFRRGNDRYFEQPQNARRRRRTVIRLYG